MNGGHNPTCNSPQHSLLSEGCDPGGTEAQEVLTQVPLLGGAAPKGSAHGCWIPVASRAREVS